MFARLRSVALLAALAFAPALAEDVAAGKALYEPYATCHGSRAEGNPSLAAPALAGQSPAYLARQLRLFRDGVRGSDPQDTGGQLMRPLAATLGDEQAVAAVIAYVAKLPVTGAQVAPAGDATAGNKQFQGKCGACHGARGQGNDAFNAPRINHLDAAYVVRQVRNFRSGIRGQHGSDIYGRQMAMMAALVSDDELKDIAAYLNAVSGAQ